MLNTVKVPPQFEAIFLKAQEYVSRYFRDKREDPTEGTIEIFGERYVLMRASSMSVEFFELVKDIYSGQNPDQAMVVARNLLYDMAHAIGVADAKRFHSVMGLDDPIEKLSAGPVHFAHAGWAFVDILPQSEPRSDDDFFLVYKHPYSFEADAWIRSGKQVDSQVCMMNAGYSSGWCSESFGVELVAAELTCRARGDDDCLFVMAHPNSIDLKVKGYCEENPEQSRQVKTYDVPRFFNRKMAEEELQKAYNQLELKVSERTAELEQGNRKLQAEIAERERAEQALKLSYAFLEIANRHGDMNELLDAYLEELKHHSGCGAVSIVVLGEESQVEYEVAAGFPSSPMECALSGDNQGNLCLNMLRGRQDSHDLLLTPGGVLFLNSTSHYASTLSDDQRRRSCLPCRQYGFESLAIVPVRVRDRVAGLIHVADADQGKIHARLVEVLEIAAMQLGTALVRLQTRAALQESEEIYRTLVETSPEGIVMTDLAGLIVKANRKAAFFHGYDSPAEMVGIKGISLVAPEERERVDTFLSRTDQLPERKPEEYLLLRKDGSTFPAEFNSTVIHGVDGEVTHIMTTIMDITERKQVQAKLALSDRMASVGMLAAGVAHEINNPLSYVLLNAEGLAEDLPRLTGAFARMHRALVDAGDPRKVDEALGDARLMVSPDILKDLRDQALEAKEGARRVRDIVRDLKTFSSTSDLVVVPVSINSCMDTALGMAFNEYKYRATLVRDYGDLPDVVINEGHLSQVFLNLLLNAADAIHEGDFSGNEIRVCTRADGPWVEVVVADTGHGIQPAHQQRVFEPFFTTKQPGAGLGLGLTICQNIVATAGGTIRLESTPGEGTRVTVRLPVEPPDDPVVPSPSEETGELHPVGRPRILIVDDEPTIGLTLARLLRPDYEVRMVVSVAEAQDLLRRGKIFELIFCDMMMPEMTGMDLFDWLREEYPDQAKRIVFMTGGTFTPRAQQFLQLCDRPVLNKPFDIPQLRSLLNRIFSSQD